jgi:DNA processing protein
MGNLLWAPKSISKDDEKYPVGIRKLRFGTLNYWGEWEKTKFSKTVAIVGSRRMSRYGQEVIEKIVPYLVSKNISVISGFMYGVDQEAHKMCAKMGGVTMAVLGYGLGYSQLNSFKTLAQNILGNKGLIISPFDNDFKSTRWSFPQRNLVVAGLSTLGIIVVEADLASGSLGTAKIGKRFGRKVWAIPGPITSRISRGTNWLIKTGEAQMLTNPEEIDPGGTDQLELSLIKQDNPILRMLENEALSADELALKLKCPLGEILGKASMLVLEGKLVETEVGFRLNRIRD